VSTGSTENEHDGLGTNMRPKNFAGLICCPKFLSFWKEYAWYMAHDGNGEVLAATLRATDARSCGGQGLGFEEWVRGDELFDYSVECECYCLLEVTRHLSSPHRGN
jgi:hypothetical protein